MSLIVFTVVTVHIRKCCQCLVAHSLLSEIAVEAALPSPIHSSPLPHLVEKR